MLAQKERRWQVKEKFNQQKYINKYMKKKYLRRTVLLDKERDKDIIEELQTKQNMNEYIKQCIRNEMKGKR